MRRDQNRFRCRMILLLAPCCLVSYIRNSVAEPPTFQTEPGWVWAIPPAKPDSAARSWLLIEQDAETSPRWTQIGGVSVASVKRRAGCVYRVAFYSQPGDRIEAYHAISGNEFADAGLYTPGGKIAFVGVELLTAEQMKRIADEAFEKCKARGLTPLPFAGDSDVRETWAKAYSWSLRRSDGLRIGSDRFKGKVVIVDCWATWCGPCMELMPELRDLWKKHSGDVEVVSICYDDPNKPAVKKAIERFAIDKNWHLVFAPAEPENRELWETSLSGQGKVAIPRLLIIDRSGTVQHVRAHNLAEDLEKALEQPEVSKSVSTHASDRE